MGFSAIRYNPTDPATGVRTAAPFTLMLPNRTVEQRVVQHLRDRLGREDITSLPGHEAVRRAVDAVPQGDLVIMPPDEREARYGKPLMVQRHRPGEGTMLFVTRGAVRAEEALERLDEEWHYGGYRVEADPRRGERLIDNFRIWTERAQDARVGRTRFAQYRGRQAR